MSRLGRWKASAVDVSLGLPGVSLSGSWQPDDAERAAAWELLVELSTRVTSVELADDDGTCREALSSLYGLFETTRGLMRTHGPGVARSSGNGNLSFGVIAVRVLNDVLRPLLSEWHPRLTTWEEQRPADRSAVEWEREWAHNAELRAELRRVRPVIRQYLLVLAEAADVGDLALAVLVPNGGQAPADNGPGRREGGRTVSGTLGFQPRHEMVRWFDAAVLAATGWRILGRRGKADPRQAMAVGSGPALDLGDEDGEVWFDYVADLGDAFDPTMAVAWHLSQDVIRASEMGVGDRIGDVPAAGLPRGAFLVMGGDEVYPYASDRAYADQTAGPYSISLPEDRTSTLLAIPGNHDWYDGLDAFRRLFASHRPIGRWQTVQDASWFSVRLPRGWWIWGIDTGLGGDINDAQRAWFVDAGSRLEPGDRVILVHPVPAWHLREKRTDRSTEDELGRIEALLAEVVPDHASVPLYLAGDSHIYAHYTQEPDGRDGDEVHHITSGGGGAFLHPTHNLAPVVPQGSTERDPYRLQSHWPPRPASRYALARSTRGLIIDRQNIGVALLLALVQLGFAGMAGLSMRAWLRSHPDSAIDTSVATLATKLLQQPLTWLGLVAVIGLCMFAVPNPNVGDPLVRRAAKGFGFLHGLGQSLVFLLGAFLGGVVTRPLERWSVIASPGWVAPTLGAMIGALAGGLASVIVFAQYLRGANTRYRIHDNEAFSGRHLRGYKHFLRLRIDEAGDLRVYVVGLEGVRPGWASALAHGEHPPITALALVDVVDVERRVTTP